MGGAGSAQTEDGRGEGEGEVVEGEAAPTRVDVSEYVLGECHVLYICI